MHPSHPWKARLSVGIIMLVLAFLGILITDIQSHGGWNYWKWMVIIYALLALSLSWYVKRQKQAVGLVTLWHELLHWGGLIFVIFLVSYLVDLGTISRFIAGIFQLILLGFGVFLAGIYIESIFILIGITLCLFALCTAALVQYMYAILTLVFIAAAIVIALFVWISHKKFVSKS